MKYLVDANVLSEPTKVLFDPRVVDWLRRHQAEFVVDAVVMAEIWSGVDALGSGRKKERLSDWYRDLCQTVTCLNWTLDTAIVWGSLVNRIKRSGFTVGLKDTLIAASAAHHGLTVVTRNVDDFTRCGVPVLNPFA